MGDIDSLVVLEILGEMFHIVHFPMKTKFFVNAFFKGFHQFYRLKGFYLCTIFFHSFRNFFHNGNVRRNDFSYIGTLYF